MVELIKRQMSTSPKVLAQDFKVSVAKDWPPDEVALDLSKTGCHTALKSAPTMTINSSIFVVIR